MTLSTDPIHQVGLEVVKWIPSALQLYRDVRGVVKRAFQSGLFEILEYDSTLELLDSEGERAHFKKRLRVKFLQDNVIAFQDYIWGDGKPLLNYRCSPGVIVDRYREGGRWNVLISLRETRATGDVEEFRIERTLQGSFATPEAWWWETSLQQKTHRLKVSIVFPKKRHAKRVVLVERNRNRTTPLDVNLKGLPDGRQILTWESLKFGRFETYTLKWDW